MQAVRRRSSKQVNTKARYEDQQQSDTGKTNKYHIQGVPNTKHHHKAFFRMKLYQPGQMGKQFRNQYGETESVGNQVQAKEGGGGGGLFTVHTAALWDGRNKDQLAQLLATSSTDLTNQNKPSLFQPLWLLWCAVR